MGRPDAQDALLDASDGGERRARAGAGAFAEVVVGACAALARRVAERERT